MDFSVGTGGKKGDWQLERLSPAVERKDTSKDNSGRNSQLQQRNHWVYTRYREIFRLMGIFDGAGADSSDVNSSYTSGEITFFPGGGQIAVAPIALTDSDDDELEWTCTRDDLVPFPGKVGIMKHIHQFEVYTEWEDV